MTAPRLEIDLDHLTDNARRLVARLAPKGISVTGVTKVGAGSVEVAAAIAAGGVVALGDSRVEHLERLASVAPALPRTLIRTPMASQAARVVAVADTSMNTEVTVIDRLSAAAVDQGRTHGVIVMVELGDLREGVLAGELLAIAGHVLGSPGLELAGIGTNLACQSGVVPDLFNLGELSQMAVEVERTYGIELAVVSGGNSSSLGWALGCTDTGRVNDLRLGEAIVLGRDPLHGDPIEGLHTDAVRLVAEVIECKDKPARPWGARARSTFRGARPEGATAPAFVRQALLAVGHQDVEPAGLTPPPGVRILGASSDHLVVDVGDTGVAVGDEVTFAPDYRAVLRAMSSGSVSTSFSPRAAR